MAEIATGEPVDPNLLGSAQVLPVAGESVANISTDPDEPWVVITPDPAE